MFWRHEMGVWTSRVTSTAWGQFEEMVRIVVFQRHAD